MNENTNTMPPEEQAEQNDRDARAEELESTFSYDGYQVVRKELFAHLRDPAIVIRKDSITFNTVCMHWKVYLIEKHIYIFWRKDFHLNRKKKTEFFILIILKRRCK